MFLCRTLPLTYIQLAASYQGNKTKMKQQLVPEREEGTQRAPPSCAGESYK